MRDALSTCRSTCVKEERATRDQWIPSRLLDVMAGPTEASGSTIRLVEKKDMNPECLETMEYLTLSHQWGAKEPFHLTLDTLLDFKHKGLSMEYLPRRFQDAISLTRRLGVRYIWIDTLCIIQNSRDDWASESRVMDKVYLNSLCTIAASDGTDATCGLFTKRDPSMAMFSCQQQFRGREIEFQVVPEWIEVVREHCSLYKRGWVTQERFLSPRLLQLCAFPFYECRCGIQNEISQNPSNRTEIESVSHRTWASEPGSTSFESISRWLGIVREYRKASLTYSSDMMVAIGGLARKFAEITGEQYLAGIFTGEHMAVGMLWFSEGSPEHGHTQTYVAPSWSWASASGGIRNFSSLPAKESLFEMMSYRISPLPGHDHFGQLEACTLQLRCLVIQLHDFRSSIDLASVDEPFNKGKWDMKPTDGERKVDLNKDLFFLPLAYLSRHVSTEPCIGIGGIYVQAIDADAAEDVRYQRVGCAIYEIEEDEVSLLDTKVWNSLRSHEMSSLEAYRNTIELV
ncbi:heterokaryon incompatibility protein-domain-containing protein [Stachybotrys elegans]|uniref:Heterokaryon incompatibility protein-domain-containing protein n=1 Tax=Stachybotrys elegans TaxID=80388 RepID=A0A8K0STI7_9HYPO|nr:heterokaryon incompatibility protein-domain-containing protein [Stachybotrys elegans]